MEPSHMKALEDLAKNVCCQIYEIERDLLVGKLTLVPRFARSANQSLPQL